MDKNGGKGQERKRLERKDKGTIWRENMTRFVAKIIAEYSSKRI